MRQAHRNLLIYLCLALAALSRGASATAVLPPWQVLEFEEKAFWATARSRLEVLPVEQEESQWEFTVSSSVVGNSEQLQIRFDPSDGSSRKRERLSRGKDQRLKSFLYQAEDILRERRNPGANPDAPPADWPVTHRSHIAYPEAAETLVVTNPHLLVLLAQQLQVKGPGSAMEVLVHTDLNFYRVRLTCGNGIPVEANYQVSGETQFSGKRRTVAVSLQVSPEGELAEKSDFSLLGLQEDIILFFDKTSGLPLQVRGVAPRIGATNIDLKSVTMRTGQP